MLGDGTAARWAPALLGPRGLWSSAPPLTCAVHAWTSYVMFFPPLGLNLAERSEEKDAHGHSLMRLYPSHGLANPRWPVK